MNTPLANYQTATLPTFTSISAKTQKGIKLDPLQPLRQWLDEIEVSNPKLATFIYKAIPAQCPFERDIVIFGRTVAHIPPLCKLNPLYDQLVGLRFRALCYLVDECGVDILSYS